MLERIRSILFTFLNFLTPVTLSLIQQQDYTIYRSFKIKDGSHGM